MSHLAEGKWICHLIHQFVGCNAYAGSLAPCLSSAVGGLIERYTEIDPQIELIAYMSGYQGLLRGESIVITPEMREKAGVLHRYGGSPIGNSRVKLTNVKDCVKRGLVKEGENPLEVAHQLTKDGVDVLHTIGGDDTNTTTANLQLFADENYDLTVVGLRRPSITSSRSANLVRPPPKKAPNSLRRRGRHNANPRMLIIHEVMSHNCG